MYNDDLSNESFDRFKSVEMLATQIFDKLPELDGARADDDACPDTSGGSRSYDISNVVPFLSGNDKDRTSVLALTEKFLGSLLMAIEERNRAAKLDSEPNPALDGRPTINAPNTGSQDVGYRAAFKRSQLPDGVEPLQGAGNPQSEEAMLEAIRGLMVEQEQEFKKIAIAEKRAFNKQVLPPLEPQEELDPEEDETLGAYQRPGIRARLGAALGRAFRNYYFLAISLSGWSTLSMMVFIDPALSTTLCYFSVFLLFVSYCMFQSKRFGTRRRIAAEVDTAPYLELVEPEPIGG